MAAPFPTLSPQGQRLLDFDGVFAPSLYASWWLAGTSANDPMYDTAIWCEVSKSSP